MAVRVRLGIRRGGRVLEAVALVNSGYEADTPQLMIQAGLARKLNLWPPPEAREDVFETAGGPLRVWILRRAARVRVAASDASSREVDVDIVLSPPANEPLIFAKDLWRFR